MCPGPQPMPWRRTRPDLCCDDAKPVGAVPNCQVKIQWQVKGGDFGSVDKWVVDEPARTLKDCQEAMAEAMP